jgi:hypothetical protein
MEFFMRIRLSTGACLALALAPSMALAQTAPRPDPVNPAAKVPVVSYESVFATYRAFEEAEQLPWRAVNDEAARLRGHRGQVEPEAPPARSGAPAAPSDPAPHNHRH